MTLRGQLLLVSLLLLSLPWAGCQFVREMEGALRKGQEQSLQATAQAVAAVLRDKPELLYPNADRRDAAPDTRRSLYASPRQEPIYVDGYDDGWATLEKPQFVSEHGDAPLTVSYQAVTREGRLYLLFKVVDSKVIYHNPGLSREPNGDRLFLRTWKNNKRQDYVIATAAPGKVRARNNSPIGSGSNAGSIRGQWQDSNEGYTLELEMPLSATGGRLGFYIANVSGKEGEVLETLGNITPLEMAAPPWLIYTPDSLLETITPFGLRGRELQVIDRQHWLVAAGVSKNGVVHSDGERSSDTFWLLRVLYRSILSRDDLTPPAPTAELGRARGVEIDQALGGSVANGRYRDPDYPGRTTLTTVAPIYHNGEVMGAVSIRQSSEEYLSLTDQAFSRLLGYSLVSLMIGIFGLLGFASILSWRIRRLSQAAKEITRQDDIVVDNFPRSRAADEIGELSRSYADLLDRLQQYNDYLRTLSRKLSHELRTPIAVIQTSLENLEQHSEKNTADEVYLARARGGLARLGNILNAMSEASGLEESIRNNKKMPLDLVPLLSQVFGAYKTVYPDKKMVLDFQVGVAMTLAAPELLVQALDKLMDNAASFCPEGGTITLRLRAQEGLAGEDRWNIELINEGPNLPKEMQGQLFNSMVSLRESGSDAVHLGLGLHIVQLIADFHQATVEIGNLDDNSGVCCSISLRALLP